jgi:hypothetical protein
MALSKHFGYSMDIFLENPWPLSNLVLVSEKANESRRWVMSMKTVDGRHMSMSNCLLKSLQNQICKGWYPQKIEKLRSFVIPIRGIS